MLKDDAALGKALCLSGLDVILTENVQHAGTHQTGDCCERTEAECDNRENVAVEAFPAGNSENTHARCLIHLEAEEVLQNRGHNERRNGNTEQCNNHGNCVGCLAALNGCKCAEEYAADEGDANGTDTDVKRNGKCFGDHQCDRTVIGKGNAKVALHNITDINKELLPYGLIKTVFRIKRFHLCRGKLLFTGERVARKKLHHEKCDRDQQEQGNNGIAHAL